MAYLIAESLLLGVLTGGLYALMACGLTLMFGVMRLINIAHAAIVVLSAYLAWSLLHDLGIDPLVASVGLAAAFFAAGMAVQRGLLSALAGRDISLALLATLGLANVIEGSEGIVWTSTFHAVNPVYGGITYQVGALYLPLTRMLAFVFALMLLLALYVLLAHTQLGRAIRATIQNRGVAQLVGVDVAWVTTIAVGIGFAVAGAAGPLVGMIYPFYPDTHWLWIGKLMAIVTLGGMGSFKGTLVAALILGIVEQVFLLVVNPNWAPMVFFAFLFGVLIVRPQGLFGHVARESL